MIIVISIYPIQFSFHFKSPFSPLKIYVKKKNIYTYPKIVYRIGNRIHVNRNFKNSHPVEE